MVTSNAFADEIVEDVTNAVVEPSPVNVSKVNVFKVSSKRCSDRTTIPDFSVPFLNLYE